MKIKIYYYIIYAYNGMEFVLCSKLWTTPSCLLNNAQAYQANIEDPLQFGLA